MTLQVLAAGAAAVHFSDIGRHAALVRDLQQRLAELGLLDPPSDGAFGPVSHWALQQFLARIGQPGINKQDRGLARALSDADPETFLPIRVTDTFEGRIVSAMRDRGFWISRHSDA